MHDQGLSPTHYFHSWLPLKGFKAYRIKCGVSAAVSFGRRDLFQICLVTAKNSGCYPGEETGGTGHIVVFSRPNSAYSWESNTGQQRGYNCLFRSDFLNKHPQLMSLLQAPLFGLGDVAVYPLTQAQHKSMATLFEQILLAQNSAYAFKHELIATCLYLLTHEALKMQPSQTG